jgi:hypothetical protein
MCTHQREIKSSTLVNVCAFAAAFASPCLNQAFKLGPPSATAACFWTKAATTTFCGRTPAKARELGAHRTTTRSRYSAARGDFDSVGSSVRATFWNA